MIRQRIDQLEDVLRRLRVSAQAGEPLTLTAEDAGVVLSWWDSWLGEVNRRQHELEDWLAEGDRRLDAMELLFSKPPRR